MNFVKVIEESMKYLIMHILFKIFKLNFYKDDDFDRFISLPLLRKIDHVLPMIDDEDYSFYKNLIIKIF